MSHRYYDGTIFHKRHHPKKHQFKYKFFMLDIDLSNFEKLKNRYFSINSFNIFSFYSKDHFGSSSSFNANVEELLRKLNLKNSDIGDTFKMRFITLPRMVGFVFNPISVLVMLNDETPTHLIAEVHNYNGGRAIYSVNLHTKDGTNFKGSSSKDMYVSPFFKRDGVYEFVLKYTKEHISLNILLYENAKKVLTSQFKGSVLSYTQGAIFKLFIKHTFLTVWVVSRTLYQTFKLKMKGLKFSDPIDKDKIRRF